MHYYSLAGIIIINSISLDIDECLESNTTAVCPRDSQCVNTNGSYTCTCDEGYFHLQDLTNDINKCLGKLVIIIANLI